jgi:hypothetical protein
MSRQEERCDDGNACDDSTDGKCNARTVGDRGGMVSIPKW